MAEAFSSQGRASYKYQYSIIGAIHGDDISAYFGPPKATQGPDFVRAFQSIWGNFITKGDPSIPDSIANGTSPTIGESPASRFPRYSVAQPLQLNLNQTGGTAFSYSVLPPPASNITAFKDPGLRNQFQVVNAYDWEGGRGARCDFWRSMVERGSNCA